MSRGCVAAIVIVVATVIGATPAGAAHRAGDDLSVIVALNAAGEDRIAVGDAGAHAVNDSNHYVTLAAEAAIALAQAEGSFRVVEDSQGADAVLNSKVASPDAGRLSFVLDTRQLQLLAERRGYRAVILMVCTPRMRQVVEAQVARQPLPASYGNRCWGSYRFIGEPPFQAVVHLMPDRDRYPAAIGRTIGVAFGVMVLLGIGSALLRRGPLQRRSLGSWVLAVGSALGVTSLGWGLVSFALWLTAAPADSVLLGRGSVAEQVARTVLPGLVFVVPALVPAAILLTAPAKQETPPPTPVTSPPLGAG